MGTRADKKRLDSPPPVAVVVSRYNESVTHALLVGAIQEYEDCGGRREDVTVLDAPGAYELPALALAAARTGRIAGVVGLGCLIKGETSHDRYIADAVAHGLVSVTIETGVPCAFGVLTVDTPGQALARAGGDKGNKGQEAMAALLDTLETIASLNGTGGKAKAARARVRPDKAKGRAASQGNRAARKGGKR